MHNTPLISHYFVKPILIAVCVTIGSMSLFQTGPASAEEDVQAVDFINLFEKMSGEHPGYRKAHARGICAVGAFAPASSSYFQEAELLNHGELPVVLRFSVGGGDPDADERKPGARGVGMQVQLPNGAIHNFTGNNFPVFAGKDPATFFGFLSTLVPDENGIRDPALTAAFIQQHPSVQANAAWQKTAQLPASFANTEFFGIHTFFYREGASDQVKFRWQLEPVLGVKTLTGDQVTELPDDFLESTLSLQIETQIVSFNLMASIGMEQDSTIDPSKQWPADREKVRLGTVTLTRSGDDACDPINFDPNAMSGGFSPSDDPVLKMRSPAYAISFGKRLSDQ